MATKVFINLPVKDLEKSKAFFLKLGFTFNMDFSDDKAACLVLGDNIFAMLLVQEYFTSFTKKPIADTQQHAQVLIALDADSRGAVDQMIGKAIAAGGTTYATPQDEGWMYQHGFADLDGHQWEYLHMDVLLMSAPN
jgi:hypothetical protein